MADIEKKLTPVGKAMGKQMVRSWQIPQFAVETEIDCEPMIAYRKSLGFKPWPRPWRTCWPTSL